MKRYGVVVVLVTMLGALVALLVLRQRSAPAVAATVANSEKKVAKQKTAPKADKASTKVAKPEAGPDKTETKTEIAIDLDRPLRAVGLGWEQVVPGVVANRGTNAGKDSRFSAAGLDAKFRAVSRLEKIEAALALGGATKDGADIAIVPLPTMVAGYEDMRALDLRVFFVVGWSRGRDALYARRGKTLMKLPRRGDLTLVGRPGEPATLVALFLLDIAGVRPERVRLLSAGDAAQAKAPFAAVDRSRSTADKRASGRRALVTTADATSLVPYVAIAPEGFLRKHPKAVTAWARAWLAGVDEIRTDVPAAARKVAQEKGAPQPLVLVKRLGSIEFIGLAENARLAGLSGRGAISLDRLFALTWKLWRGVGVLTTPAPDAAPLNPGTVAALVLGNKRRPSAPPRSSGDFATNAVLRVSVRQRRRDDNQVVDTVGLVAGVFERSALRVGVAEDARRSNALIGRAVARFDLPPKRFKAAPNLAKGRSSVIEILAAP